MRALCKDSQRRYQTAAEMAADLRKTVTHPRGGFVKYPQDAEEVERQREARRRKRQKSRRRLMMTALVGSLIMALCVLLLAGWYFLFVRNRVSVPKVLGQTQAQALEALERAGLPAGVERTYSEEYEAGVVLGQSREPGERVRKGSGVTLIVSAGTQWYSMEELCGRTEDEAVSLLREWGVESVSVQYVQSDAEIGRVVAQSPEPGWQTKDAPVTITVSGRSVLMPTLTGLTLDGARALLEAEGLLVGEVIEGDSADAPANTVIAQDIAPNSQVLVHSTIRLTVSGARESAYSPDGDFTVVVPLENLEVMVTLTAPSGTETTVYSQKLAVGTHAISLASIEPGLHTVRVYLDGVLMDSTEIAFS